MRSEWTIWPKRIWWIALGIYLFCQMAFLIGIQFPRGHNFDEFHYVPSAKQFLSLSTNQNWEHPPLGKEIMAVGIAIGGDRPLGWRLMSTVFGAATVAGVFLLAWALFYRESAAWFAALLTLFNQMTYVQSRIGMLDTFMTAFLIGAIAFFCAGWSVRASRRQTWVAWWICGIFLGLAMATKWFGVIAWFTCLGAVEMAFLFRRWGLRLSQPRWQRASSRNASESVAETEALRLADEAWFSPELFQGLKFWHALLALGLGPLLAYYVTFLPFFFIPGANGVVTTGLWDVLVGMQAKMWDGQLRVVTKHPYMSHWASWPLMLRPIWYAFDKEGSPPVDSVRGVLLLGNPAILWGGLAALGVTLWGWVTERSRRGFLILLFWAAFFLSWMVIPRKISFFYYYYPAAIMLSLAIAYFFEFWERTERVVVWIRWAYLGAVIGFFIYFFPILAALKIPAGAFRRWMWFSSWI